MCTKRPRSTEAADVSSDSDEHPHDPEDPLEAAGLLESSVSQLEGHLPMTSFGQQNLVRVLCNLIRLYHRVDPSSGSLNTLELPTARPLAHAHEAIYHLVGVVARHATEQYNRAADSSRSDGLFASAGTLHWDLPTTPRPGEGSAAGSVAVGDSGSDATSFRDAYMALLADGAAEELDALRREEPAMDEAALRRLLDALESGCESFGAESRSLLLASYQGRDSWWETRGSGPPNLPKRRDEWESSNDEDEDHDQHHAPTDTHTEAESLPLIKLIRKAKSGGAS